MICAFIAFALFSVPCMVLASSPAQGEEQANYGRGRIYNKEGFKIQFKDIHVGENVFVYTKIGQVSKTTVKKILPVVTKDSVEGIVSKLVLSEAHRPHLHPCK